MANRLNIYACSGIGDQPKQSTYNYWLDNINPATNTQAVNLLSTQLNLLTTKVNHMQLSYEDKVLYLNTIDLYTICLFYAQEYSGNTEALISAGYAIGKVLTNGSFHFNSTDNTERDSHLDALFDYVGSVLRDGIDKSYNSDFDAWWNSNIINLDVVGLSPEQQKIKIESVPGIGAASDAVNDQNIGKYLNDAGNYFLYTYLSEDELKRLPRLFRVKKKGQMQIYYYCKDTFVKTYGTEQAMQNLIRAKIIETYGVEPEAACKDITNFRTQKTSINGVGAAEAAMIGALTVTEFITVLTTVLGFIGGLIMAILAYCAKVQQAKYAAMNAEAVKGYAGSPDDYNFDQLKLDIQKIIKDPITWIVAGLVLLVSVTKNK